MAKTPKLRPEDLVEISPKTKNQAEVITSWNAGQNLILNGSAGTGKTFLALHLALKSILSSRKQKRIVLIRSAVPTRDVGFLPGKLEEKTEIYELPYISLLDELVNCKNAWELAKNSQQLLFSATSFIRGITFRDAVVIVDEMQNMSAHELDSIITRMGDNSRVIFAGDYYQSDLKKHEERQGLHNFLSVLNTLSAFDTIEFNWSDIVRSSLVREYICAKEAYEKGFAGNTPNFLHTKDTRSGN